MQMRVLPPNSRRQPPWRQPHPPPHPLPPPPRRPPLVAQYVKVGVLPILKYGQSSAHG